MTERVTYTQKRCRACSGHRDKEKRRRRQRTKNAAYYVANKEKFRTYGLQRKYKITQEQYEETLAAQNGHCAVCPSREGSPRRQPLFVDHDHVTGEFRGLLCGIHNVALGMVRDDASILEALAAYLRRTK